RHAKADFLRRGHHALGDDVAAHDPAEDVHQNSFDMGIGEDELEGCGYPLARGTAADIEEIGRRTAIELDDVHGGHGEPGAIHHAADIAVELDVVEAMLGRFEFGRVLFRLVAQ